MNVLRSAIWFAVIVVLGVGISACQSDESSSADAEGDAWHRLFDGESTEGWYNPYDWGKVWVENGEVRLQADEKFFLVTEETYSDFVFEADVRVPDREANSGFMFRANVDTNRVWGYQAEVDPSERAWSGGLYDEARRGWLHPADGDSMAGERFREEKGTAFHPTDWNTYRIRAEGDSLKIWVNGTLTTAYRDTVDQEGHIGLQHHGEEGKIYRFRNIRLREL
jgi:hypothetical protein